MVIGNVCVRWVTEVTRRTLLSVSLVGLKAIPVTVFLTVDYYFVFLHLFLH